LDHALEYFQQTLPIRREVGDRPGEATTLHNWSLKSMLIDPLRERPGYATAS
jgi:hypothetical protein